MRIDLYNSGASQISSDPNSKQVQSQELAATDATESGDRTTLTSGSVSVSSLVSQAMSSPDVRQDKVSTLAHAVQNTYVRAVRADLDRSGLLAHPNQGSDTPSAIPTLACWR